jgi:hypothetical protein
VGFLALAAVLENALVVLFDCGLEDLKHLRPATEGDYLGLSMGDISYVAAVGASAVAGVIMWWACGRYESRLRGRPSLCSAHVTSFAGSKS